METLINKIETAIQHVINGFSSQYINYATESGEQWTIRISNHKANPSRQSDNFISLVIELPEQETGEDDSEISSFCISKKNFNSISNQYFLNENGNFTEEFSCIEEMLEFHID